METRKRILVVDDEQEITLVLRSGLTTTATGLAIGLAAVIVLSPLLGAFLYGVGTVDVAVIASATVFFLAVALAANYIPALRATRADPMDALRYQ